MIRDLQKASQCAAAVAVAKSALKDALQNQRQILQSLVDLPAFREQVQQIATKHGVEVVRYAARLSDDEYVSVEHGRPLNTMTVVVSGPEDARTHFVDFNGDMWQRLVGDGASRTLFDDGSVGFHYIAFAPPPPPEPEPVVKAPDPEETPPPEPEAPHDEPVLLMDDDVEAPESWEKPEETPPEEKPEETSGDPEDSK